MQLSHDWSYTYTCEFWRVIEQSRLNDFTYNHLICYDDKDEPVGLASFYSITTDIAIFAPNRLRTLLAWIRRILPNFLKFRMLECGTPITLNKPFVCKNEGLNEAIIKSIHAALVQKARTGGYFLFVFRDFEPHHETLLPYFRSLGYHIVDSLPTTFMEIKWATPQDYIASMKSYYRSKLLKRLRANEQQGVRHELREDFNDLADTLCRQWQVVHESAEEYQREVLTPHFYKEFASGLGNNSMVILFYRGDQLVGHALLLKDGDLLRWLYFGRNEPINDNLYIYVAYTVVETAILNGAKRLELGLTTYSVKKDLGAYMVPIKLALKSPLRLINPFVGLFYPWLNHSPEISNKDIFKS